MSRTKQQLIDIAYQIEALKADLLQSTEQLLAMEELADDASLRAIVSETPDQAKSAHDLVASMQRLSDVIFSMESEITKLIERQDELLEKLFEESNENAESSKKE